MKGHVSPRKRKKERLHKTEMYGTITWHVITVINSSYVLWPIWIFRMADVVFGGGRYRLAVADFVADMVAPSM